jgi:hypothetical protein
MRLATALLALLLCAGGAGAQELGVHVVGAQVWDAGTVYHTGYGFSLGILSRPKDNRTRMGLRLNYDRLSNEQPQVFDTFRSDCISAAPCPAFDVVDGPSDDGWLRVTTLRWVFLPQVSPMIQAEIGIGAAWESGRWNEGISAVMGLGLSFRLDPDSPILATVNFEQRINGNRDGPDLTVPNRLTRSSFRFGVLLDAKWPATP